MGLEVIQCIQSAFNSSVFKASLKLFDTVSIFGMTWLLGIISKLNLCQVGSRMSAHGPLI